VYAQLHVLLQVRYTPLHCAVVGEQPDAVIALLLKGAACDVKDYVSRHLKLHRLFLRRAFVGLPTD